LARFSVLFADKKSRVGDLGGNRPGHEPQNPCEALTGFDTKLKRDIPEGMAPRSIPGG